MLLAHFLELASVERRRAQLFGQDTEHECKVGPTQLGIDVDHLETGLELDRGAHALELAGNRELIPLDGAALEHHGGELRHTVVA